MPFLRTLWGGRAGRSDAELTEAYRRDGDLQVLGWLYEPYMDQVYGVCLRYLEDGEAARDAVLGIFEVLVRDLRKDVRVKNFKAWLFTVSKHYCLMQLRSAKSHTVEFQEGFMQSGPGVHLMEDNGQEEGSSPGESREDLLSAGLNPCLDLLPPDQRKVILLFYRDGKCYKEIESMTGLAWKSVRSHIQNGRRNLKLCMERKMKETIERTS